MGWAKSKIREIDPRNREAARYAVKVSHTGNYTTGGGVALEYGNILSDIGEVLVRNAKGYQIEPSLAVGSKNKVILLVKWFDYDAGADGAAVEHPNATPLTITDLELTLIGKRGGNYPDERSDS